MKKIITTVFCTALTLCSGLTAYAAENLDRDDIEAETVSYTHLTLPTILRV